MKISRLFISLLFCSLSMFGRADSLIEEAKIRCKKQANFYQRLSFGDFSWGLSLFDIKKNFQYLYQSSKRLSNPMYYDPTDDLFKIYYTHNNANIIVTENFIKNTILHIQTALKKSYADFINFADMGHSHFLIPKSYYNSHIKDTPINETHVIYTKIIRNKNTKVLYHTAEQLKMSIKNQGNTNQDIQLLKDSYLQYRYFNRNIIGDNKLSGRLKVVQVEDPLKKYNTVIGVKGYRWWGNGNTIHSHRDACIPYKHEKQTYYFDINFDGLTF
ncbi:MAG: hypothetical protein ACR2M7_06145 [Bdellovibrionales bacterium]